MREILGDELHWLSRGQCPACEGASWQPGPKGGAAQNFECTACGVRFNLTIVRGKLVFAQDIGHRSTGSDWSDYEKRFQPRALFD
jgi:hypothetical protein